MKGFQSTLTKATLLVIALAGVGATGITTSIETTTTNKVSTSLSQWSLSTDLASELNPPPGSGAPKPENTRAAFQTV